MNYLISGNIDDYRNYPLNKRFQGIVTNITVRDKDILIKLEDNMGYLKKLQTKNIIMKGSNTIDDLINSIKQTWNIEFDFINDLKNKSQNNKFTLNNFDYNITDVTFTDVTPVDIFKYLTERGLKVYFRRNILYIGLKYWNAVNGVSSNITSYQDYGRWWRFQ